MLEFLKMMLNVDFLLFLLGIYWNDIAPLHSKLDC